MENNIFDVKEKSTDSFGERERPNFKLLLLPIFLVETIKIGFRFVNAGDRQREKKRERKNRRKRQ